MSYQRELLELARELAATEGLTLAAALERAARELRGLELYAQSWDEMVGQQSPARPIGPRVSAA